MAELPRGVKLYGPTRVGSNASMESRPRSRGKYIHIEDLPRIEGAALERAAQELEGKAEKEEDDRGELWRIADAFRRAAEICRSLAND